MQRGPDCLSGSQTTAGLVSLDAFARSKDATASPPHHSHFHPWWCTPPVLLGCLGQRRWPVERSNAWVLENKRLALRYDRLGFIIQSLLQSACIFLVARRLARQF
jgi:hypothetical protein